MKLSICLGATSAGLGVLLIIGGAVLGWVAGPAIVKSMVQAKLRLTDRESDGFEYFVSYVVIVYLLRFDVYFFGRIFVSFSANCQAQPLISDFLSE